MPRYRIKIRETKTFTVQIEATTPEAAMGLAKAGAGIGLDFARCETYAEILSVSDGNPPTHPVDQRNE